MQDNPKIAQKPHKNHKGGSAMAKESNIIESQGIESTLESYLKACKDFEDFLQHYKPEIDGFHPHFKKAFWEMLENGGKRFRPNLLFAVVEAHNPLLIPNAFLPSLALECLHTYSLIHDDLPCMDNATLRRAHPTLHTTYGETTAVLVGDGLNTFAFYLLSESKLAAYTKVALIKELALNGGIGGMIIGQAMDCFFENQKLDREKLQTIHTNKTAKLIATSLKMGGIIIDASQSYIDSLERFGLELGLFFQIRDDVIDVVLDSAKAGKTTQNDSAKNSYVNLLGLNEAKELLATYRQSLLSQIQGFSPKLARNLEYVLRDFFEEI
ncbi:dimethylallyltransferase [Helicobacter fennelliae MRY12-0050]|uniref:Dimethylallyltransferase n=2 Tax=Helicobacter fennelliae TaxID=215 RepID=T1DWQ6_9HELI|nr:dimethylallyltransferase [Helicobacter fennelliae MRY12-0050]